MPSPTILAAVASLAAAAAAPSIARGLTPAQQEAALRQSTPASDRTVELLTARLRDALLGHVESDQDALLRSLRQLRDPGLRALFAQIAASDRAVLRIHGILGLAELESPPRVDMLLVKRMEDPREQLVVVGEALRAGMLPTGQLQDVARWPGLDPALVVLVLGRLQRAGVAIDPASLDPFLRGEDQAAAVFAALERREALGNAAGGASPADELLERVLALPRGTPEADETVAAILGYIRQERLTRSSWFARRILDEPGSPDSVEAAVVADALRFEALRALLTVAPAEPRTLEAFAARFADADDRGRLALAVAVLDAVTEQPLLPSDIAGPPAPALAPALFDVLRSVEESAETDAEGRGAATADLLRRIADAGQGAMLGCAPGASPVLALVAEPHPAVILWAVRIADLCRGFEARDLHLAILETSLATGLSRPEYLRAALASAAALADLEPSALRGPLARALAFGDISGQRAILTGALRATNPGAGALGQPPTPLRPLDDEPLVAAMATLLRARHNEALTEGDFQALAAIALSEAPADGPSAIPEAIRVQAAWLALRCRGQQRAALARILAAESSPPGSP